MINQELCFRPSVTLFVHETGKQVQQQFRSILELARLDPSLAPGIGLLLVEVDAATKQANATPCRIGPDFPPDMPDQDGTLEQRVEEMVKYVQGLSTLNAIYTASYDVSAAVQIYIVGNANDPWLGSVLKTVRQQLRLRLVGASPTTTFEPAICYILDCVPSTPRVAVGAATSLPPSVPIDWSQREIADFSFLFDDRINFPNVAFVSEDELRHYMMAETLFALIATSITIDTSFKDIIEQQPGETYNKLGNLRTSVVSFPRAAVERYCNASFGVDLMNGWLDSLRQAKISKDEVERERSQARSAVEAMKRWFKDSVLRPNADPDGVQEIEPDLDEDKAQHDPDLHLWPTLDILRSRTPHLGDYELQNQQQLLNQLNEETSRLFELFLHEEVDQEYEQYQRASRFWADIAYGRSGKAPDRYLTWETRAEAAWSRIEARVAAQVKESIDQKWPEGDSGVALSSVYVDEYYTQLTKLSDMVVALREQHERKRTDGLEMYREKASPWINAVPLQGPGQGPAVIPQFPGQIQNPAAGGGGIAPANPTPQQGSAPQDQHLTSDEESIARALKERAKTYRARIPSWSSILTSMLLSLAGGGVPLLAFFPAALTTHPLTSLIVALAFVTLGGAAHAELHHRRKQEAREAESDLLKFFCLCYANRCERFEDLQREMLLGPLRRRVYRMLRWLEDREGFITRVRDLLSQTAQVAQNALFEGPSDLFDIFVVNGSQLGKSPVGGRNQREQVTLDEVTSMIKDRCKGNGEPGLEWHNDPSTIRKEFFASFQNGKSILEMSEDEARDYILNFMGQRIVSSYLTGDFVDTHYALREEDLQRRILQYMQRPLFPLLGVMQPQRSFACGWKRLVANGNAGVQLNNIAFALTDEREWYLFASLFYGNTPFTLDIDALLPIR